jgi:UPF0042 nucleotide-binding protein
MNDAPAELRRFLLVSGISGAGRSTTLDALEDQGYEVVDNLPLFLFDLLVREGESRDRPLAIGIDSRTRDFSADALLARVATLRADGAVSVTLIFVDADDETLLRRFTETRRRHPLALDRPVIDGIQNERSMLEPIKMAADVGLDTSDLSLHDLRRIVGSRFSLERSPELSVFVTSFPYRKGLPRDADLTIAVGCTGGKHRSVYVAERLAARLREQGIKVGVSHRGLAAAGETLG